jgi:hypothetical protein
MSYNRLSSRVVFSFKPARPRAAFVTRPAGGRDKKYDNDSKDVVRSTVFTFTPLRAVKGAGAKFKMAFTPAVMI